MQLYRSKRVMATDVDTLSMAAYSAARRGIQSGKVGRLWHYKNCVILGKSQVVRASWTCRCALYDGNVSLPVEKPRSNI